jgi:hypothetical protein
LNLPCALPETHTECILRMAPSVSSEGIFRHWALPAAKAALQPIAEHLRREPNLGGERITMDILASTAAGLQAFCEKKFGRLGPHKEQQVKLPARVFEDFSPDGPLSRALFICFQHKIAAAWTRFGFDSSEKVSELVSMVGEIETHLLEAQFISRPVCHLSTEFSDADASYLGRVLAQKGAHLTDSAVEANYIVVPDPDGLQIRDTLVAKQFIREVERQRDDGVHEARCRIHWWYFPDSCAYGLPFVLLSHAQLCYACAADDEWLPISQAPHKECTIKNGDKRHTWFLHRRWVDDLAIFNEYMNPADVSSLLH